MAVDDGQAGWWTASDGKRYPPELHPDFERLRLGSNSKFKPLPYGGTCVTCGVTIPRASQWVARSIDQQGRVNRLPAAVSGRDPNAELIASTPSESGRWNLRIGNSQFARSTLDQRGGRRIPDVKGASRRSAGRPDHPR